MKRNQFLHNMSTLMIITSIYWFVSLYTNVKTILIFSGSTIFEYPMAVVHYILSALAAVFAAACGIKGIKAAQNPDTLKICLRLIILCLICKLLGGIPDIGSGEIASIASRAVSLGFPILYLIAVQAARKKFEREEEISGYQSSDTNGNIAESQKGETAAARRKLPAEKQKGTQNSFSEWQNGHNSDRGNGNGFEL